MNKTRWHFHIFLKNKLTHRCIKSVHLYQLNWPYEFSLFFGPVRFASAQLASLSPPWCRLSSDWQHHTVAPCHIFFPLSQDELAAPASSFSNALSHRLPPRAEIEVLNLHHHRRPLSLDRPTHTIHCYKKTISILITLPTTQLHLNFGSSIARASRHQSPTSCRRSLSLPSHAHRPFAQWHPRW
jgi:hypothetical protein